MVITKRHLSKSFAGVHHKRVLELNEIIISLKRSDLKCEINLKKGSNTNKKLTKNLLQLVCHHNAKSHLV